MFLLLYFNCCHTSLSLSLVFLQVLWTVTCSVFAAVVVFTMEKLECMFSFVWTRTSNKILSLISVNLVFEILFFFLKFLQMKVGFTMTAKNDLVKNLLQILSSSRNYETFFFCLGLFVLIEVNCFVIFLFTLLE